MTEEKPSEALVRMALIAIERGFRVIGKQGGLPPMIVYRAGAEHHVDPLPARDSREAQALGRRRALELSTAEACVLLYETYLHLGERTDAVVAEAHERGAPHAFVFARRYRPGRCCSNGSSRPQTKGRGGVVGLR